MVHNADASDGRDGPVEQQLAVVEIDVSAKAALQKLHESERGGNDHLKNVVGRVPNELPRRGLQIQHASKERSRGNEQFGQVVASCVRPEEHKIPQVEFGGS